MAANSDKPKSYIVKFQGNNSKRWDGKETWIEAGVLDEFYDQGELVHGVEITVPWRSKGKITHWKGIFVDPNVQTSVKEPTPKPKKQSTNEETHSKKSTPSKKTRKCDNKSKATMLQISTESSTGETTKSDKAVSNESILGKLFDQQQQILKLLSQVIQPTTILPQGNPIPPLSNPIPSPSNPIQPLSNPIPSSNQIPPSSNPVAKETNTTSNTAQSYQQVTLETLLSDDLNGTTDEELDFLNSPSWQSCMSSGEQNEQYCEETGYQPTKPPPPANQMYQPLAPANQTYQPTPPPNQTYQPPPANPTYHTPSNQMYQPTTPANPIHQPLPPANQTYQPTPPANPIHQPLPPANQTYQPTPPANPIHQPLPPANQTYQPTPPANPIHQPLLPPNQTYQPTHAANLTYQPAPPTSLTPTPPATEPAFPPPPFSTPPKLVPVEHVMKEYPGTDAAALRRLTTALAREAIFGKEEMCKSSLSDRNKTGHGGLNKQKLEYIKTVVKSRVPNMPDVQFEAVWNQCRGSLSKSCQTLRTAARKKIFS